MDQSVRDKLREALVTVTALKTSMEHSLRSDPNAVWRHWAYGTYMRKYNHVVAYIKTLMPINAPIDVYDLAKVPDPGDTLMPVQKQMFESVHANLSILETYLSTRVDLPAEKAEGLRYFFEANLRKAIFDVPTQEREVQNAVEQLLIGRGLSKGIDYDRETGRVKVSIKEVVPDFILPKLDLAIEVKLAKTSTQARTIVDEINADIQSYGRKYKHVLFIVYDLGTIRDVLEFTRDLESVDGVEAIVVKH
jgi:DpnII restriction endonuclease